MPKPVASRLRYGACELPTSSPKPWFSSAMIMTFRPAFAAGGEALIGGRVPGGTGRVAGGKTPAGGCGAEPPGVQAATSATATTTTAAAPTRDGRRAGKPSPRG